MGGDGWAVAGDGSQPRPPPKASDLSNFGKITKTSPMTFGPSGVFANKEKAKRDSTISRGGNMFSMLSQNPELVSEIQAPAANSSGPPNRTPSVNLGSASAPEVAAPTVRRKLVLQPRTVPKSEETSAADVDGSVDEGVESASQSTTAAASMSEDQARQQTAKDLKELLSVRSLDEAEGYFTKLPAEHHHRLVHEFVMHAFEAKEEEVQLIADVFSRASHKNLCSAAAFEQGFTPAAEVIDDIAIGVMYRK